MFHSPPHKKDFKIKGCAVRAAPEQHPACRRAYSRFYKSGSTTRRAPAHWPSATYHPGSRSGRSTSTTGRRSSLRRVAEDGLGRLHGGRCHREGRVPHGRSHTHRGAGSAAGLGRRCRSAARRGRGRHGGHARSSRRGQQRRPRRRREGGQRQGQGHREEAEGKGSRRERNAMDDAVAEPETPVPSDDAEEGL